MTDSALTFLDTLVSIVPGLRLDQALSILDAARKVSVNTFDLITPEGLIGFARSTPEVMQAVADEKKILAIKALRVAAEASGTRVGLKEAKDALDTIMGVRAW